MVSVLFLLLKLPFWVLMAAEFFENSLAPGGFCWIIVAVGTLWIVTLFKHAELLCSSFYCRIWNGSKFQNHLYGEVHSNLCVQEGWGLGSCVAAVCLCTGFMSEPFVKESTCQSSENSLLNVVIVNYVQPLQSILMTKAPSNMRIISLQCYHHV